MAASESENNTHKMAPHPFNLSSADIVLLTRDLTEFHVLSSTLALASPVFDVMFSLPRQQAVDESIGNTRPIVHVTEDSSTFERLLRLCYPTTRPTLDVLDDIVLVLEAAMKYDMEWMIPLLMKDLKTVVPQSPVKAWAMACRTGTTFEDVAREAASTILANVRSKGDEDPADSGKPASPLTLLDAMLREQGDEILHEVSAGDYFRLRRFIVSESSNSSFRLLTSPQESASSTTFEAPSPSASILRIGSPDILLRCSADGTQHEAHSFVLSFHSPVLRKAIEVETASIPSQPYDLTYNIINRQREPYHPSPVISLETGSEVLAVLLGLCYSTTSPPSHLPLLASALVASRKYAMHQVEKLIAERWDELAELNPLEAYFVAVRHGLETCARAAARAVLKHPITNSYVKVMESSSALAYQRILDYYGSCTDAVEGHFKRVIGKWNAPPQYYIPLEHTDVVVKYLSSLAQRIDSEGHGPGTALDLDLSGLFRRFCSSSSSVGDMLWSWKFKEYCTWVVDELLDISAMQATITQVELVI